VERGGGPLLNEDAWNEDVAIVRGKNNTALLFRNNTVGAWCLYNMDFVYKIRFTEERSPRVEGNTEEENNGYVVFEGTVKKGAGVKGWRYSVRPSLSATASGQVFKDDGRE
jgi:hypothetical protein